MFASSSYKLSTAHYLLIYFVVAIHSKQVGSYSKSSNQNNFRCGRNSSSNNFTLDCLKKENNDMISDIKDLMEEKNDLISDLKVHISTLEKIVDNLKLVIDNINQY